MAEYGYSTPYRGTNIQPLPPGYMEAATAPGRMWAQALGNVGQNIGAAIQQYRTNKAEHEASTQTFETLSGMAQQALASDPQYQAVQGYFESGQLPAGITEKDINRFAQKVQSDRAMLNKMSELGSKFGDMSLAKKKAAIGDMAMVLNQYQNRTAADTQRMQNEAERLRLEQLKSEALGAQELPSALRDVYGIQRGQAPQVPFKSVESEILSRYPNLTPSQIQAVVSTAQERQRQIPAGMRPEEAVIGGVKYGRTPEAIVTTVDIPNTNKVQPVVDGKPFGSPVDKRVSSGALNEYESLSKEARDWADDQLKEIRKNKQVVEYQASKTAYDEMQRIAEGDASPTDSIGLVVKFMKSLDPQSVVRESEMVTAQKAGSIPESVWQAYNNFISGTLTDQKRKMIVETAKKALEGKGKSVVEAIRSFETDAKTRGIEAKYITSSLRENLLGDTFQQIDGNQTVEEKKTSGGVNYRVKRN